MISGIPFEGPIGAVRIAYSTDGEWLPHPTYQESDASVFELVVAGRQLDDGDVAIMMVEAGGTRRSFEFYAEGAPKVDEAVLANGLEASKQWIKVDRAAASTRRGVDLHARTDHCARVHPVHDYGDDVFAAVEGGDEGCRRRSRSLARPSATWRPTVTDRTVAELAGTSDEPGSFAGQGARDPRGRALTHEEACAQTHRRRRAHRRTCSCQTFDRCPQRSASCRPLTAPGLFQRGETQVLDVCTLAMPHA